MSHGDLTAELRTVGVIGTGTMGIGVVHDLMLLPLAPLAWLGAQPGARLWAILIGLGVAGVGLGLSGAGLQTTAIESVGPRAAGVASGVFSTSRYLGSIVGSSLLAGMVDSGTFGAVFAMVALAALGAVGVGLGLRDWPVGK